MNQFESGRTEGIRESDIPRMSPEFSLLLRLNQPTALEQVRAAIADQDTSVEKISNLRDTLESIIDQLQQDTNTAQKYPVAVAALIGALGLALTGIVAPVASKKIIPTSDADTIARAGTLSPRDRAALTTLLQNLLVQVNTQLEIRTKK